MGKATDELIDIYIPHDPGDATNLAIPVKGDNDTLQDVLYQVNTYDGVGASPYAGGLWLLHGSTKIPVHLNPKYSVPPSTLSSRALSFFPNPADRETRIG